MIPAISKSYLVEVNLGAVIGAAKIIPFLYVPELDGKQIYIIQTFGASDLSLSPNGNAVVTNAALSSLTCSFQIGDVEQITLMPCADLNSAANYGAQRVFFDKKINLTKSYVTIQNAAGLAALQSVMFNFIYR